MRMKKFFICCIAVSLLLAALPVTQVQASSIQKGFDVSSKNGVVDWEKVAESDMDFVMLRTGEGQAPDVDAQFEANYEGAKAAGLKVGAYHVCCVRTPEAAVREAEYCLEILDGRKLDDPLAYDIEKPGCFADGKSRPKLPTAVDIWQYTSEGNLEGANTDKGCCDLNYSYMEASSVKFVKSSLSMKKGTTVTVKVKLSPGGCTDTVRFSSSNKKVVVVNSSTGKLRAKAKGKAVITVKTGSGKTAKMKVVVK